MAGRRLLYAGASLGMGSCDKCLCRVSGFLRRKNRSTRAGNLPDCNQAAGTSVGGEYCCAVIDKYVMRKQLTPDQIEDVFRKLNLIFEFADFSPAVLERAVAMKWKDFEDAVQSATAESVHADYIVTRNLKDFMKSKVIAFTPAELLARI